MTVLRREVSIDINKHVRRICNKDVDVAIGTCGNNGRVGDHFARQRIQGRNGIDPAVAPLPTEMEGEVTVSAQPEIVKVTAIDCGLLMPLEQLSLWRRDMCPLKARLSTARRILFPQFVPPLGPILISAVPSVAVQNAHDDLMRSGFVTHPFAPDEMSDIKSRVTCLKGCQPVLTDALNR